MRNNSWNWMRWMSMLVLTILPLLAHADRIVIGQSIDLSGPGAALGRDYVAGIKTYFDGLNSRGGVQGKRIHYVVYDDRGEPARAAEGITELIQDHNVDYLMGGIGDETTQAILNAPRFRRSEHILFAPVAGASYEGNSRVMVWRPGYKQEIRHIFSHFAALGFKEVGVAYQDGPLYRDVPMLMQEEARRHAMTISGTARIGTDNDRLAGDAARLARTAPRFVVVIADGIGTALFLKEFRKHQRDTYVAGTSLTNLEMLVQLAGPQAVEWTLFSQVVPDPRAGRSLLQIEHLDMLRRFRDEPPSSLTLEGFAVAKSLVAAITMSGTGSRSALRELGNRQAELELGGLAIVFSRNWAPLSRYLDIALFRKGGYLVF
jgi:branched-chain amino acid transport system substrate-binding protein